MQKILIRISINTLIGVILIYAWTRFVNINEVLDKLYTTNLWVIVAVGACLLISTFLRAARFWVLLPEKSISLSQMGFLNYISQFLSFIIPIRIGEFTKGIYLSNQGNIPISKAILWTFVDRLVDFWIVISIIGVLLLIVPTQVPANISQLVGVLSIALSLGVIIAMYYPKIVKKTASIILKIIPFTTIRNVLLNFASYIIDSFVILKISPKKQALVVILTTISWGFEALAWYMVLTTLGVLIPGFAIIQLGTMLMALSFALPAAPGYLGSLQAAGLLVFSFWLGFDPTTVSAATVLMHLSIILYILIAGIGSLYFLKLDLRKIWEQVKKGKQG